MVYIAFFLFYDKSNNRKDAKLYETLEKMNARHERIKHAAALYNLQASGSWVKVFGHDVDMSMWNWMEEDFSRHLAKQLGKMQ